MSKPYNIELFLAAVLKGSHSTRARHIRQAKDIQAAIDDRWHCDNPWTWQEKHITWFLSQYVSRRAESTRYYYLLTLQLLTLRLGKPWQFKVPDEISIRRNSIRAKKP
ncbi:hypothetical protein ABEH27_10535 [Pseudomonas sp. P39-UII1]|uniref:hypothetical protein n=1 Tax=Pseudomonas sp. P39-UII1 TaxID=3080333 RepID=UPI00320A68F3